MNDYFFENNKYAKFGMSGSS